MRGPAVGPFGASAPADEDKGLTTLGRLKHIQDPSFEYFEWHYLSFIKKCLTDYWWILQGKSDDEALSLWYLIFRILELDRKAQIDMLLLAHSGLVGRTVANEILWNLLSKWALDPRYEDLSHKVSSEINWARRRFDRPPRNHQDLWWWSWRCYEVPDRNQWSPLQVPRVPWSLRKGDDGRPLPPPECWELDPPDFQ